MDTSYNVCACGKIQEVQLQYAYYATVWCLIHLQEVYINCYYRFSISLYKQ